MEKINLFKVLDSLKVNYWMLLALLEFLVIVFLFFKNRKIKKPETFFVNTETKEAKKADIDLGGLFQNIGKSRELHNILKKKIHPDRFPNDPHKIELATKLAAKLNENQLDFKKLEEIKNVAILELNISFK
jgi:uncharacterized sporulation protein YeaH/YhbH (DUF444 family)